MPSKRQINDAIGKIIQDKQPAKAAQKLFIYQSTLQTQQQKYFVRFPILFILENQHDWISLLKCLDYWKNVGTYERQFYQRMKKRLGETPSISISKQDIKKQIVRLVQKYNKVNHPKAPIINNIQKYLRPVQPIVQKKQIPHSNEPPNNSLSQSRSNTSNISNTLNKNQNLNSIHRSTHNENRNIDNFKSQLKDNNSKAVQDDTNEPNNKKPIRTSQSFSHQNKPILRRPTLGLLKRQPQGNSQNQKKLPNRQTKRLTFGMSDTLMNLAKCHGNDAKKTLNNRQSALNQNTITKNSNSGNVPTAVNNSSAPNNINTSTQPPIQNRTVQNNQNVLLIPNIPNSSISNVQHVSTIPNISNNPNMPNNDNKVVEIERKQIRPIEDAKQSVFEKKPQLTTIQRVNPIFKTNTKNIENSVQAEPPRSMTRSITPHKPMLQRKKIVIKRAGQQQNMNSLEKDFNQYNQFDSSYKKPLIPNPSKTQINQIVNSQEAQLKKQIQLQIEQNKRVIENPQNHKIDSNKQQKKQQKNPPIQLQENIPQYSQKIEVQVQQNSVKNIIPEIRKDEPKIFEKKKSFDEVNKRTQVNYNGARQQKKVTKVPLIQIRRQDELFSQSQLAMLKLEPLKEDDITLKKILARVKSNVVQNFNKKLQARIEQGRRRRGQKH